MERNLLSQKAMLAHVSISKWAARRTDEKVTAEVRQQHGAAADAGRYSKMLIAKEALAPLSTINGAARDAHYTMTQPWLDDGARILPSALYTEYANKMREFRTQYGEAADKFAAEYPAHIENARRRLNGMFRAADYPHPRRVRDLFTFDVKILPCPDAKDFRVDLASEHATDIREEIEARMRGALEEAMREPVRRIIDVVGHMAERLRAYSPAKQKGDRTEGQFRDTLVENVRDLVDLLPAFNLTGDRALADITERMKRDLLAKSPAELRDNPRARKAVASAAEAILAEAQQFMA